jgi:hypothetical protein
MVTSLRATSRTIADFLQRSFEDDPILSTVFGPPGTMRVYLNTPSDMTGARIGLSVWLYRVVRDDATLNRPEQRITPELSRRVPLPLRLHYLLTPITNSNVDDALETEQVILGKVLQCFHVHPQLAGTDLHDDFEGTDATVTVRLEVLALDEMSRIWDAMDINYHTSLSYEVTVIEVEAGTEPIVGPPVRVPLPEVGILVGGTA